MKDLEMTVTKSDPLPTPNARRSSVRLAKKISVALAFGGLSCGSAGCTGQIPNSFRFNQAIQTFSSTSNVNTKIDLLWVVDNSASMDVSQQKLRNGISGFATIKYKITYP